MDNEETEKRALERFGDSVLVLGEDEEEETTNNLVEEDFNEIFYLGEHKKDAFEIYKVVRLYTLAEDSLNPALIESLANKRKVEDLEELLIDIALIHSGFLNILYKDVKNPPTS